MLTQFMYSMQGYKFFGLVLLVITHLQQRLLDDENNRLSWSRQSKRPGKINQTE